MSKTELIRKKSPKLSVEIRKFWGPPQCLGSGSEETYWRFASMVLDGFDPVDPIMLVLIKDFVDHSFQIRELRGHKANLLKLERATRVTGVPRKDAEEMADHLRSDIGETQLFLHCMDSFVAIDKIIADTERRRDDALAQIEFYREAVARRLSRNAEAAMIEGEVIEHAVERITDSAAGSSGALERTAVAPPRDATTDAQHPRATARVRSSAAAAAAAAVPPEVVAKSRSAGPSAKVDQTVAESAGDHPGVQRADGQPAADHPGVQGADDHPAAKPAGDPQPNVRAGGSRLEHATAVAGLKARDRDPG
jgi:hypothetical protein